ncbi:MAG: hypothetical protein ACP5EQ_07765 [Candidatus Cloacimonadia bacterium]
MRDQKEIYEKLQAKWIELVDLKKGDHVKVTARAIDHQFGFGDSWSRSMNKSINKIGKVTDIWTNKIFVNIGHGYSTYSYPFFVLEKIENPENYIEIDGKEYSKDTIKKALQEYVK